MSDAPLLHLHRNAGAALGTWFGCTLPERFADFAEEYRRARDAVALLDTNYHAFAWLTGADRARYLNAVTTPDIQALADGYGTLGLLLSAQGHILAELACYALADRLFIVTHASVGRQTFETLEKFIIMDDAALEDAAEQFGSLALEGPKAAVLLHQTCGLKLDAMALHSHREVMVGAIPCRAMRSSHFGAIGAELIAERAALPALWQILGDAAHAAGGGPVGCAALNALRLEAGVPWFGYDFDEKVIPHEAGLENTHISYTKGCYTGQEIVERVRSRGHVNRRRVGLKFSGSAPPAAETVLLADGKEAGRITSAAFSPAFACPIGMGYLRREYNAVGSQVQYDGETAQVIELPVRKA